MKRSRDLKHAIELHIFLDGSVLKVFINDEKTLSTRIFPEKPGSTGLDLFAEGGADTFQKLDVWNHNWAKIFKITIKLFL